MSCTNIAFNVGACARNLDNRKSTSSTCFFIRNYLITWMNKKQNSISLSTIKVNYITIGSYIQLLLIKHMLYDYKIYWVTMSIMRDN